MVLMTALAWTACRSPGRDEKGIGGSRVEQPLATAAGPPVDIEASTSVEAGLTSSSSTPIATSNPQANRFLNAWLQGVLSTPPTDWVVLAGLEELPRQARAESESWARRFFRPVADPYRAAPPPRVSVHLSPDRIRLEHQTLGMQLRVDQNAAYTLVRVPSVDAESLAQMKPEEQASVVNRIGALLFQSPTPWIARQRSSEQETVAFSTSPETEILSMPSWRSRIDAGVFRGQLYYMFYERIDQLIGFPSGETWFDPEFRARHARRR
jgi:hypothetical protein